MNLVKYIYFLLFICQATGNNGDSFELKIYNQMLLLKSKLDANPILWQDTREGFLRNRAVRVCDTVLDSLGTVSSLIIIKTYYPLLDSLLIKIRDDRGFDVFLDQPKTNYQINYFYSSSKP